jgi:hypothetical protein
MRRKDQSRALKCSDRGITNGTGMADGRTRVLLPGSDACRKIAGQFAKKLVGARQLVRQDRGRVAHFTVGNRCNLPRRAHHLASAYKNCRGRNRGRAAG